MRRARLFYTPSHDIYSEVRCYVNWNSVYDVRFDAQFHYVCYRYKPFARVVHFVIPGVVCTRYLDSPTQLAASTGCINVV